MFNAYIPISECFFGLSIQNIFKINDFIYIYICIYAIGHTVEILFGQTTIMLSKHFANEINLVNHSHVLRELLLNKCNFTSNSSLQQSVFAMRIFVKS